MKKNLIIFILSFVSNAVMSQSLLAGPFSFPVSYTGEVMSNLMGGIAQGTVYLGYGTIGIGFDTEKAKIWKGGSFYIEGASTHGGTPSADYIGDIQIASNIEAGNHTYLQRMYFSQRFGHFKAKLGLLDLNDDFAICDAAGLFHNSSFGTHSLLSYNFAAPIFPLTGLGFVAGYDINEHWNVKVGVYDGGPIYFEPDNPYNVNWELNIHKGYLFTTEVEFMSSRGCYNISGYYHTALQKSGVSVAVDQNILETDFHKFNCFLYTALGGDGDDRVLLFNLNAGLKLDGLFSRKMRDSVGIGCALSSFVSGYTETALELVYSYKVGSWLSIEPDLQYIINPPCDDFSVQHPNALAASLRFVITL